eukprot:280797_1
MGSCGVKLMSWYFILSGISLAFVASLFTANWFALPYSGCILGASLLLVNIGCIGYYAAKNRSADLAYVFYTFNFIFLVAKVALVVSIAMFVSSLEARMTPKAVTTFVDKVAGTTSDTHPNEVPPHAKAIVDILNKLAVDVCYAKKSSVANKKK